MVDFPLLLWFTLREKLLFDFLTFCAKSAYSRSKAFLRRERRLGFTGGYPPAVMFQLTFPLTIVGG